MEVNPARYVSIPHLGRVPIGKLLCIGRNYAKHAKEMKSALPRTPMVFLKPTTALIGPGGTVELPPGVGEVHHEVELVLVIGHRVRNTTPEQAALAVSGYAVGLDMTARALQAAAKKSGTPWSVAKGYDTFAPIGEAVGPEAFSPDQARIALRINGRLVQEGRILDMIFGIPELVAFCSTVFTLEPGDLIYTGTPEGVGPVRDGDRLRAEISGLPPLEVSVSGGESG
jgi:acylpyruvate hydrolase